MQTRTRYRIARQRKADIKAKVETGRAPSRFVETLCREHHTSLQLMFNNLIHYIERVTIHRRKQFSVADLENERIK